MTETNTNHESAIEQRSEQAIALPPTGYKVIRFIAIALMFLSFILSQFGLQSLAETFWMLFEGSINGFLAALVLCNILTIGGYLLLMTIINSENKIAINIAILSLVIGTISTLCWHFIVDMPHIWRLLPSLLTFVALVLLVYSSIHIIKNGIEYAYFYFTTSALCACWYALSAGKEMISAFGFNITILNEHIYSGIIPIFGAILNALLLLMFYKMLKDENLYCSHKGSVKGITPLNCTLKEYICVPVIMILFVVLSMVISSYLHSIISFIN